MKERKPIFYDSEKVRWRRTRRILEVSGGLLTLLLVYFFLTIAGSVELPASLKKHYKDIDLLMPEQLHAVSADGAITVVDYERNQTVKASPGEAISRLQQDKLHQWMRSLNPPVEIPMMGLLNNYDGTVWRVKEMAELLANPAARNRLISDVTQYAVAAKQ